MNFTAIMFYMLSGVLLSSAILVVVSRNTVHGVLFLILAFINAAGLFVLAHAEFLAMMLIVVYVGAVAVLFLFVVMMINVDHSQQQRSLKSYMFFGIFIGSILAIELFLMIVTWSTSREIFDITLAPLTSYTTKTNTQALGNLLYTHYALVFEGAGIVLLIAMVGAILLTLRHREGVKKQKLGDQLGRQAKESLRLVDISSGSGV